MKRLTAADLQDASLIARLRRMLPFVAYPTPALRAFLSSRASGVEASCRLNVTGLVQSSDGRKILCQFTLENAGSDRDLIVAPIQQLTFGRNRFTPRDLETRQKKLKINAKPHHGHSGGR